jgi:hypothetical protein
MQKDDEINQLIFIIIFYRFLIIAMRGYNEYN